MSKRSILRLIGALQLADGEDCIGLPLFSYSGTNHNYVAICGDDLRIAGFALFEEFEDYQIDSNLPFVDHKNEFEIGDPMPIPVWVDGQLSLVLSNSSPQIVDEAPFYRGARPIVSEVLNSLHDTLYAAHSGKNESRRAQWQSDGLRAAFGDVFYEAPVHSRYWISRFILAASAARKNDTGQIELDEDLRELARRWLSLFITKTDFNRLATVAGFKTGGPLKNESVFTIQQARDILFVFLAAKIEGRSFRELERHYKEPIINECFPSGIYGHYIAHGWPDVDFEVYQGGPSLLSNFKGAIYEANRTGSWTTVEKISCIMFGKDNAPNEIQRMIDPLVTKAVRRLQHVVEQSGVLLHSLYAHPDDKLAVKQALELYTTIQQMDGVVYGQDRMNRSVVDGRYGVSRDLIENLRFKIGDLRPVSRTV